jgi:hypothetical protein
MIEPGFLSLGAENFGRGRGYPLAGKTPLQLHPFRCSCFDLDQCRVMIGHRMLEHEAAIPR